jgi:hypothetical protein
LGPLRHSKRQITPATTAWDTEIISPIDPSSVKGPVKAQGSKAKPARWVRAAQSEG